MKFSTLVGVIQSKLSDWGYLSDPDPIQEALNEYLWATVKLCFYRVVAVVSFAIFLFLVWVATGEGLFQ